MKYEAFFWCVLYLGPLLHMLWVPEYGSKFPSTGLISQVRVICKQFHCIWVPKYESRYLSKGQGSRVQVQDFG